METHILMDNSGGPPGPLRHLKEPPSPEPSQRCTGKWIALATVMVLVMVGLSAGLGIMMPRGTKMHQGIQVNEDANGTERFNNITIKAISLDKKQKEYRVFTVPKTGIYFIHGQVRKVKNNTPDTVVLSWRTQGQYKTDIQRKNVSSCDNPEIIFAKEVKLQKSAVLILRFNTGQADMEQTVFHIYKL